MCVTTAHKKKMRREIIRFMNSSHSMFIILLLLCRFGSAKKRKKKQNAKLLPNQQTPIENEEALQKYTEKALLDRGVQKKTMCYVQRKKFRYTLSDKWLITNLPTKMEMSTTVLDMRGVPSRLFSIFSDPFFESIRTGIAHKKIWNGWNVC
jgi:hypothetical protein